jgi:hypothetical protein
MEESQVETLDLPGLVASDVSMLAGIVRQELFVGRAVVHASRVADEVFTATLARGKDVDAVRIRAPRNLRTIFATYIDNFDKVGVVAVGVGTYSQELVILNRSHPFVQWLVELQASAPVPLLEAIVEHLIDAILYQKLHQLQTFTASWPAEQAHPPKLTTTDFVQLWPGRLTR